MLVIGNGPLRDTLNKAIWSMEKYCMLYYLVCYTTSKKENFTWNLILVFRNPKMVEPSFEEILYFWATIPPYFHRFLPNEMPETPLNEEKCELSTMRKMYWKSKIFWKETENKEATSPWGPLKISVSGTQAVCRKDNKAPSPYPQAHTHFLWH